MDTRPGLVTMLLAGRVIEPLTGMMIGRLAGGMADICVDMLTEVCMTVVVVVVITLEGVAPLSYTIDVRAGLWVGTVFSTDVVIVVRVDVMVGLLIDVSARTGNGDVPDIGVSADVDENMWVTMIAVLELRTLLAPLEELLLFCWTAFRCWSIAVLGCRALQAWMPSCHVR